jgi:hypothetical protein
MYDEYFKNVKRSAIQLTPRQPFFDWLLQYDPAMIISDDQKEGEVYLLPDMETKQQMNKWLRKNYDGLFAEQLHNWYVDETMWPQHRNFKIFEEWFTFSLHTMVWDTQKGPVEKV